MSTVSSVYKGNLKCFLICLGSKKSDLDISVEQHGTVVGVKAEVDGDGWLEFSIDGVPSLRGETFKVGNGANVIGFVLKYGGSEDELEALYTGSSEIKRVCCYCGRVKVCGEGCSC